MSRSEPELLIRGYWVGLLEGLPQAPSSATHDFTSQRRQSGHFTRVHFKIGSLFLSYDTINASLSQFCNPVVPCPFIATNSLAPYAKRKEDLNSAARRMADLCEDIDEVGEIVSFVST